MAATKYEFEEAPEDEADPDEDEDAPVETEGLMLGGGRKMRHQHEKVEQGTEEDSGELFEEAGTHVGLVSSFAFQVSRRSNHGFTRMNTDKKREEAPRIMNQKVEQAAKDAAPRLGFNYA